MNASIGCSRKETSMNLYRGVSIIFQTVASADALLPFARSIDIVTLDNTEATLQIKRRRDDQRYQARKRAASLDQIDVNQLPLVATDRSAFERALHKAEATTIHSETPVRINARRSEHEFDATAAVFEPRQPNKYTAEFQFNMESIR
jgi:hypothetical protein